MLEAIKKPKEKKRKKRRKGRSIAATYLEVSSHPPTQPEVPQVTSVSHVICFRVNNYHYKLDQQTPRSEICDY